MTSSSSSSSSSFSPSSSLHQTDLSNYSATHFVNERAYLDFDRLAYYLQKAYPANSVPVLPPQPPPARALDRRSINQPAETFLKRIVKHPLLARDHVVVAFLESPAAKLGADIALFSLRQFNPPDIQRVENNLQTTWSDKIKSLVSSAPRDIDAEFDMYKEKVTEIEYYLKKLKKCMEEMTSDRQALGIAHVDMGLKTAAMGVNETDPSLASMWAKMSKRFQNASDIYSDHASNESIVMSDYTYIALKLCDNTQHMLNHRLTMLSSYDDACRATEKQKRKMERLKGVNAIQGGKVDEALQTLNQIKLHEVNIRSQFRSASDFIKKDKALFIEQYRMEDMIDTMDNWARCQTDFEKRLLNDMYLPMKRDIESCIKIRK